VSVFPHDNLIVGLFAESVPYGRSFATQQLGVYVLKPPPPGPVPPTMPPAPVPPPPAPPVGQWYYFLLRPNYADAVDLCVPFAVYEPDLRTAQAIADNYKYDYSATNVDYNGYLTGCG
jgi:hypothetical protein